MSERTNEREALLQSAAKAEEERLGIVMKHMAAGVLFTDWKTVYIDKQVKIGKGSLIEPGVMLAGQTVIGEDCVIGFNSKIKDSIIGDQVDIQCSVILESKVGRNAHVGPFAYLRPHSDIGEGAKVGDFVEVKNSRIGNESKVSHLTYVGDADIGDGVNLGCGVVFVNYNGTDKNRSTIADGAFIGCNTNLIAPVNVGEKAYVAAGATITEDIPAGALCIGRTENKIKEGWVERRGLLKKDK